MAFSYQITASNGPIISYSATGLPAGLSVNTSTGLISGTPTTAGTYSVTISATNSSGQPERNLDLDDQATASGHYQRYHREWHSRGRLLLSDHSYQ